MATSSRTLGDLFDTFEREAFRLETLDDYNAGWIEELRSHTAKRKRIHRVHILRRPLSDYLRFELGWGYQRNMSGGEEFFILDGTGTFLGAEVLSPERTAEFARFRDVALAQAEPFTEWWAKYRA
ncbi:hypothetical protein OG588_23360 [Streptomyces prunicolor]|uniref:DUF6879 family protein n=1 Tax=Streptomyces prunicolor TaxID=67348 RepID=UPI00386BA3D8|nr:hypothetical protein OG588_23360 [Streptomyces prunicolor]